MRLRFVEEKIPMNSKNLKDLQKHFSFRLILIRNFFFCGNIFFCFKPTNHTMKWKLNFSGMMTGLCILIWKRKLEIIQMRIVDLNFDYILGLYAVNGEEWSICWKLIIKFSLSEWYIVCLEIPDQTQNALDSNSTELFLHNIPQNL